MKRFVLYLLSLSAAIVALALAVDWVNVALIRSSSGNSACKMERLYANPEPDEIAIVGSSRACGSCLPSVLSPSCFNYGENGMTMGECLPILQVLQKRKTMSPVILNVDPWGVSPSHDVADYRLVPESGKLTVLDRIPGLRFFGALRKNIVQAINERRSFTQIVDRGAKPLPTIRTDAEWKIINAKVEVFDFELRNDIFDELCAILHNFTPRQVYVIVVPCSCCWMERYGDQAKFDKALSVLTAIPNVKIVSFFGSDKFTNADFADPIHLNISGARRFSAMLKEQLRTFDIRTREAGT